ncbi:MAG: helix-turn-helix transcriptional regulator [Provencibacterium sp.]|jgi:transcriptional regulator with XRE-family HTH domain|nr:helix-turn-helix transcriptional regulator [Provencibacterium sp.]
MSLGERIKALRRERELTQEYLAEQLQVSRQAVSKWERGLASPSMEKLLELSRLFEIPLSQLTETAVPSALQQEGSGGTTWKGRSKRLWQLLILAAAAAVLLAAGCFWLLRQRARLSSSESAESDVVYARLSEYRLGETFFALSDGGTAWLRLILTEGEYFTGEYEEYIPWGGAYPVNYQGSYRLEVCDADENRLFSYPLNGDFDSENMNFPGEVDLALFDYNRDGRPEVSIGQYGSSSILLYALYTLKGDGSIQKICPELIADSSDLSCFSILFPREEGEEGRSFRALFWNNASGMMEETVYHWETESGQFLADH